jgi:hypothetical protein
MSTRTDPLSKKLESPDRVFYATGVLLDAQDFEAEQNYHRGRLARVLAYAHGSGTVAGLGVAWEKTDSRGKLVDRVVVEPGMAIDRVGRIIEVTRPACIRLQRWYDAQDDKKLTRSCQTLDITPDKLTRGSDDEWRIKAGSQSEPVYGVVVDVFVKFVACERGKTPAFASGPFDATDAVQPSRLRDGYEISLELRESDPGLPKAVPTPAWPALDGATDRAQRERELQDEILGRWQERSPYWTKNGFVGGPEHLEGQDTTSVFLARMVLPASTALDDTALPAPRPRRLDLETNPVRVDNHLRSFVYTAGALAQALPWTTSASTPRGVDLPEPSPAPGPQPPSP